MSRDVVSLLLVCVLAGGVDAFAQSVAAPRSCAVSPLVRDTAPRDQGADPVVYLRFVTQVSPGADR